MSTSLKDCLQKIKNIENFPHFQTPDSRLMDYCFQKGWNRSLKIKVMIYNLIEEMRGDWENSSPPPVNSM